MSSSFIVHPSSFILHPMSLRNRIVGHRAMLASQLKEHPLNPRTHGDEQRAGLRALLDEIGLARSVLAYVADADMPDNAPSDVAWLALPLTLIDGHLRRSELGDEPVQVEILDVNDDEARKLLLSMDPLAALAEFEQTRLAQLRDLVSTQNQTLQSIWDRVGQAQADTRQALEDAQSSNGPEKSLKAHFLCIVTCKDERHQREVLNFLKGKGLEVKAVLS
jgi:hypothetical protein